jgi:hypothetical protein
MASLWRTQRPRFPHYISDGNGRDYYIKYNNAGYWEGQFKIYKKPDYEYPKYSNYHTLFHQAAPLKYYATGNGRETYILNHGGLYHEQRPLASYKLGDFIRGSKSIEKTSNFQSKKRYLSLGEKKYNSQLKSLEKNLVKRLYKVPIKKNNGEENELLPSLEGQKEADNNIMMKSTPNLNKEKNKLKRNLAISTNDDMDFLLKQTQKINKYEMKNNARRSNNETDYNMYKNGRIGCRINNLNSMKLFPLNSITNKCTMKRFNTEGNKVFPRRIEKLKIQKNKCGIANKVKTMEKENA